MALSRLSVSWCAQSTLHRGGKVDNPPPRFSTGAVPVACGNRSLLTLHRLGGAGLCEAGGTSVPHRLGDFCQTNLDRHKLLDRQSACASARLAALPVGPFLLAGRPLPRQSVSPPTYLSVRARRHGRANGRRTQNGRCCEYAARERLPPGRGKAAHRHHRTAARPPLSSSAGHRWRSFFLLLLPGGTTGVRREGCGRG